MKSAAELVQAALQHHQAGRLAEAEAAYQEALRADPRNVDAQHFLGVLAFQRGAHERAEKLISQAIAWQPANAPAHNNLGNVLLQLGRARDALASYRQAIALQPAYIDAHANLCSTLAQLGEPEETAAACRGALLVAPEAPLPHFYLGNALSGLGRHAEAAASYRKALALGGDFPEAHSNLGNALRNAGRLDEAAAACERALELRPGFAQALCNLGVVRKDQGRADAALDCFRKAVAADPGLARGHLHLGHALTEAGELDQALACFDQAGAIEPALGEARWARVIAQLPAVYGPDEAPAQKRAAFARELEELDRWFTPARLAQGFEAVGTIQPFFLAYQEENNRDLLMRYGALCARIMGEWQRRQGIEAPSGRRGGDLIRIGVVSHQFRHHSVWNAIVKGWFRKLDRKRFALDAFYLGADHDAETALAQRGAASFTEGAGRLREWAEVIARRQPDVLIYPEIGMNALALRLAALRLAPLQAASWGHPETTGLPTIDCYFSAAAFEPAHAQAGYSERLVALPNLGCFYEEAPPLGGRDPVGPLPDGVPLLVCPGTPQKYAPQHDAVLSAIARRLGRCRMVFFAPRAGGAFAKLRRRLEAEFARAGLRFDDYALVLPWLDPAGFQALLKRADLFLDTIGFSGFNTAMQAIESGLPLVTRAGRFMRGRFASGIVERMGLPELVAGSDDAYVELAVKIVQQREYAADLRRRIAAARGALLADEAPIRAMEDFLAGAVQR
jgi:predicted O-linked N-acetylglucosamine transferase (SPINDLY family)